MQNQVGAGVDSLSSGAEQLNGGIKQAKAGAENLKNGAASLCRRCAKCKWWNYTGTDRSQRTCGRSGKS